MKKQFILGSPSLPLQEEVKWVNISTLLSKKYVCGFCSTPLASNQGFFAQQGHASSYIYICHHCNRPTFFDAIGNQYPGAIYGNSVEHLPSDVQTLYDEARLCTGCSAFTAAVLCCRKLLMNIAVSKGEQEGLKFVEYIEFLSQKGFVPPNGKEWVNHIRKKGNEATHEIKIMNREDAEELITFIEMLLKFIYEFPESLKSKIPFP